METKVQTFRDRVFQVIKGTTHPEYSYFTFEGEEREFREKFWDVQPGDIVLDVGASYGAYTLAACALDASTVLAFEPEPTVYIDLARNVAINDWLARCTPMNFGLWSYEGFVNMASYAPHWPQQTISGDYRVTTLDRVARDLPRLDWIKIDVEGAEAHVLKGGLATIAKHKPKLIIECHTFLDAGLAAEIKELLTSVHGYSFEEIPRPPCVMLVCRP